MRNKLGFTLAEVLITMSVVGIIFVMVLPMLNNSFAGPRAMKVSRDKIYKEIYQAVGFVVLDNVTLNPILGIQNYNERNLKLINEMEKKLSYIKTCSSDSFANSCWSSSNNLQSFLAFNKLNSNAVISGAVLSKGVYMGVALNSSCNLVYQGENDICGFIILDVNGKGAPNSSTYSGKFEVEGNRLTAFPGDQLVMPIKRRGASAIYNSLCAVPCDDDCSRPDENCTVCREVEGCIN